MKTVTVADKTIGDGQPAFMIAEAGLNHNGDVQLARELVAAAADCGADAVKFQTFSTDQFILKSSPYYDIFKSAELRDDDFVELSDYARQLGITFLSTPFDFHSVDVLDAIGVDAYKIASCDLTNSPLLEKVAAKGKPILLSTGMASMGEIFRAVELINNSGNGGVAVFHCIAHYPSAYEEMNIRSIPYMASVLDIPVGLSDHTLGIDIPTAAIALGANMIEKHFTLDKGLPGPDHQLSATPDEFRQLVNSTRNIEKALGQYHRVPVESDDQRTLLRRSLCASRDLPAGTVISAEMITIKRPGSGLPPDNFNSLLGRKLANDIACDHQFSMEMFA
ncbi:MAG: N-acetylneuraminate synthase family protein [Chromatiales bacterium]|jgi:N-acetylneuraminate synthase/N,N'-diacetyllegionaminate synthase